MLEKTKGKRVLLAGVLIALVCSQTTYMNVAALLPTFIEDHHPSFSSFMVGLLLSAFQVGYLTASPLCGIYMGRIGRKNVIVWGLF